MILIIRGHIRDSFNRQGCKQSDLYNLIQDVYMIEPNLKIYIHTWNIFANNVSWRYIKEDNTIVTKEIIYEYFGKFRHLIEHIIIDDDSNIQLIGNIEGYINRSPAPLIGWKKYWHGVYSITNHIYQKNICDNDIVINFRFDIHNNSNRLSSETIIQFIKNNIGKKFTKNVFIQDKEYPGLDNIYIGNIDTMYRLSHSFFHFLDDILLKNSEVYSQEVLVYKMNNIIFE